MESSLGLSPSTMMWIYEVIPKLRLTYAPVVWEKRVEKKFAEVTLRKLRRLVLSGATEALNSTITSALGTLLGIGSLRKVIGVQAAKAYYRIKYAQKIRLGKVSGPRDPSSERLRRMSSKSLHQIYIFDKKFRIFPVKKKG